MIVTPLAPFGAEVAGVTLDTVSADAADRIADLVARHRVVVLRRVFADDAAQCRLIAALGEPMFTDGETPVAGAPTLNVVSNVGRTTPPRSVFHTDSSYLARPPSLTLLRPVKQPASGGATLFTDQVAVAAALPAPVQAWLAGRTVVHAVTGLDGRDDAVRQPILRRHPRTGEASLYLSTPERCRNLDGVDPVTSRRIVALLYRRSIRADRLYRHRWQDGDLLIWDNRVTLHRADHDTVAGDRVLHRGLVQGEVPIAA